MMNDDFETLIGLVSQYSPSGQERGAVEWLVARMKALGFNDAFIDDAFPAERKEYQASITR